MTFWDISTIFQSQSLRFPNDLSAEASDVRLAEEVGPPRWHLLHESSWKWMEMGVYYPISRHTKKRWDFQGL